MTTLRFSSLMSLGGVLFLALVPLVTQAERNFADRASTYNRDQDTRSELRVQSTLRRSTFPSVVRWRDDEIVVKFSDADRPTRVATRGRGVREVLSEYRNRSDVAYAEPNYIATAFGVPNDPLYAPYQWHFDNPTYGGIHAETAWSTTSGAGVVVAVVDTGIAYETNRRGRDKFTQAPDLAGTSFVAGYDFVNDDDGAHDDEGHGTHVAGTIAGTTNNDDGVAGLAYSATLMPVKVLDDRGSGSYFDVAAGIRFAADNGADVINLSLGGPVGTSYLEEAVCYAKNLGVTVVAASGNDSASSVSYPAAYDDCVIAVGATRFDENHAWYSNYGAALDLVAPGGDTRVDQNGDGYGDGVLQQTFDRNPNDFGYYFYQGTSMASPHVAGAAALLLSAGVATTPDEIQTVLTTTADDLGSSGWDRVYGHGLINLAVALDSTVPVPDPEPEPEPDPEPEPNQPPVADAGLDQTAVDEDNDGVELVTLDGTDSSDSDGTIVSYDWFGPAGYFGNGSRLTEKFVVGNHSVWLTVTDDDGASSSDEVVITVEAAPIQPEPPSGVLFSDDFENGLTAWSQDRQTAWDDAPRTVYSGSRAAKVSGDANDALLVSPALTVSDTDSITVSFAWLIDRRLDAGDYLAFDVSTDGGATWATHRQLTGDSDPEDSWLTESVTVATPETIQIRFRGTMSHRRESGYVDAVVVESF